MSPIGILYTVSSKSFTPALRVLAVAALAGIEIDIAQNYKHFEDNKKPEFLTKFASGKIPALQLNDGFTLFESSTISRYVASLAPDSKLLGENQKETALVDQWMTYTDNELSSYNRTIYYFLFHLVPYSKPVDIASRERQAQAFATLDKYLSTRTFFVGDHITVADIHIASTIVASMQTTFDATMREKYPYLVRHFDAIVNHPKMKSVFGEIKYLEKALEYVPKEEKSD